MNKVPVLIKHKTVVSCIFYYHNTHLQWNMSYNPFKRFLEDYIKEAITSSLKWEGAT